MLRWLHSHGVATYVRPNGRIFPLSGKASDVVAVFEALLSTHSIEVLTNARALSVERQAETFCVHLSALRFQAHALILATGGVSYSKTGTTGDGIRFAAALGHTIVPLRAALAPIYLAQPPHPELVGVSLRHVRLIAKSPSQTFERTDDVLFTHQGLSGPACLSISRDVAEALEQSSVTMYVDFFPALSVEALEQQLLEMQRCHPTQALQTFLEAPLPNAIVPFVLEASGISLEQKWHNLSKAQRKNLLSVLKAYPLGTVQAVPIERGEVSAGGISLREIDPKTMASQLVPNLFIAGEVLNIAGEVGGFNLQAAYSTGWLAGKSAAHSLRWD
ncbi:MAG: aminoacetone oxidase family FAD-binding enzyme [Chloroherpetonaceae bacterium]|nr:aminoacetone oxidase family FAD-binding enzyme [Chloroherpetonaceae bacterium]